jgi:HPt (histidine-containing phosphotransfer) domain-containing protein
VLMDVQMPEMDGLEATRRIRDPESAVLDHGVPIIAMTAHAMQGDRERCLAAGMDDYVTKPISPQVLADALDRWLPPDYAVPTTHAPSQTGAGRASAPPEATVFDEAGLLGRLMGDEALARAVIDGFLDDAPRQIDALTACLRAGDASGASRQAHTIKGASATVGGEALASVAQEMERAAMSGDLDGVRDRLPDLEAAFDRLRAAMTEFAGR